METANSPMTQDRLHVEITNEDNSHHFHQYQGYFRALEASKKKKKKCNEGTESYAITGVPKIFPTMTTPLG
jgi:hypothetical protein